jgi:hypothetical protein
MFQAKIRVVCADDWYRQSYEQKTEKNFELCTIVYRWGGEVRFEFNDLRFNDCFSDVYP